MHPRGPVTCLNVTGNAAVIKIDATALFGFSLGVVELELVDNGGSGSDRFGVQRLPSSSPTDCSGGTADAVQLDGRAVVFDAKPLPTSTDQCKNGGWQQFGFKSQGRCVAFVILTRICDAFERHGHHLKFCPPTPPVARQP